MPKHTPSAILSELERPVDCGVFCWSCDGGVGPDVVLELEVGALDEPVEVEENGDEEVGGPDGEVGDGEGVGA